MPHRITKSYKNNFYHIYNRGNNKNIIFFEDENYKFFLDRIKKYFSDKVNLVCYCLMPNHYHLLVRPVEDGQIEKIMQKLSLSYTKAINKRFDRVGHLFQDRYKIKVIQEINYLLHLSRYVHLNPVRAFLVNKPEDWLYSSYRNYIGVIKDEGICSDIILNQFSSNKGYKDFVNSFTKSSFELIKDLMF